MLSYWAINAFLWSIVMIFAAKGAFVAAFMPKFVRRGDPMRLAVFLVAALFVGHPVRWIWFADNLPFWKALNAAGALTALYVGRLMFAYGRGALMLRSPEDHDFDGEYYEDRP